MMIASSTAALEYNANQVKAECSAEWGSQYDMVKYCIDKRKDGWAEYSIQRQAVQGIGPLMAALDYCEDEWTQQWDMVSYCTTKQIEGAKELVKLMKTLPDKISSEIMGLCYTEWEPQYDMVTYCANKQATAWQALNN